MADYNITMKQLNAAGSYDVLLPYASVSKDSEKLGGGAN